MDIVISHISALRLMRQASFPIQQREARPRPLPSKMPSDQDLAELATRFPAAFDATGRVDILICEKTSCRTVRRARAHLCTAELPAGALLELAPGVRCVSALLLPALMSSRLSFLEMNLLLAELLGLYAVCPAAQMGLLQRARPLTTPEQLEAFLAKLGPAWGTRRVKEALVTAPVLAASPQEARLYLRITLPAAKGGYNMGQVTLNDPVDLRRISRRIKSLQRRKPDLLFTCGKGGVALDYMGAWHDDADAVRRDTQRRNELLAAGFKPYEIYKRHYDDLDYMDELMRNIRADLGLPRVKLNRRRAARQRAARRELYLALESIDVSFESPVAP